MIEVIPWDPAVKGTALRAFVLLPRTIRSVKQTDKIGLCEKEQLIYRVGVLWWFQHLTFYRYQAALDPHTCQYLLPERIPKAKGALQVAFRQRQFERMQFWLGISINHSTHPILMCIHRAVSTEFAYNRRPTVWWRDAVRLPRYAEHGFLQIEPSDRYKVIRVCLMCCACTRCSGAIFASFDSFVCMLHSNQMAVRWCLVLDGWQHEHWIPGRLALVCSSMF